MSYLKCKDCRYETFKIDDPYGLPSALVKSAIDMHRMAYPNHELHVIDGKK